MIPSRFPDEGQAPEYNTVDATLWYFEAIRAYHEVTHDHALLRDLFPALQDTVDWHLRGTRYQIHVDPSDGLLYAGEPGVQFAWMDAKVDDWVVTPRIGKPVEVNALWYNARCILATFARLLEDDGEGLLTEPIPPRSETFGDPEKPTRRWQSERARGSPASGTRRQATATTSSTGQMETTLHCAPTSSLPCRCPTARCLPSGRRPW